MRHVVVIAVALCAGLAAPLATVGKQVYITSGSMKYKHLCDSVAVLKQESQRLRLVCDGLSDRLRIETVARERLGLEYPSSVRISVLPAAGHRARPTDVPSRWEFFAILKRSFTGEKG
jgi:cell division protein FtsL